MKKIAAGVWALMLGTTLAVPPPKGRDSKTPAKEALGRCVTAMGGEERLRNVETLSYQSFEHNFFHSIYVSDSLPGMVAYERYAVVMQPRRQYLNAKYDAWTSASANQRSGVVVVRPDGGFNADDEKKPLTGDQLYSAMEILSSNPVTALLAALDAPDLTLKPRADGSSAISFQQSAYGQPVKITVDIGKHRIAAVD